MIDDRLINDISHINVWEYYSSNNECPYCNITLDNKFDNNYCNNCNSYLLSLD